MPPWWSTEGTITVPQGGLRLLWWRGEFWEDGLVARGGEQSGRDSKSRGCGAGEEGEGEDGSVNWEQLLWERMAGAAGNGQGNLYRHL